MRLALTNWKNLFRTAGGQPATLDRRHVYILPSKAGLLFALMIVGMLIGSINYSLNMGYVLAFWLMGLGVVTMLHTWRNLAYLNIAAGKVPPVFAGEEARFSLLVSESNGRTRNAIGLKISSQQSEFCDVAAYDTAEFTLNIPAKHRGWLKLPKVSIFTRFPLGLFHTWGYADCDVRCLVYPRPAPHGLPLPTVVQQSHAQGLQTTQGDEDFSGLRNYRLGDSMRRVDWKASAREQGLYTKEFEGLGQFAPQLDWETTPGGNAEAKIAQLTRWVLDAHAARLTFGLRLPNVTLKPASDEGHFREALKALALL
ncbi:MAG: DUF58 domain-containing protein [Methylophilaceae bacterium]